MEMDEIAKIIGSLLIQVIVWLACGLLVMWQARKSLERREFMHRVNFSLNIIDNGHLYIRTLIEKSASEVFLNPAIAKMVAEAAQKTSENDSILPISKEHDYWMCLNPLLNEISEKFAYGHMKRDIQGAAASRGETYVICLTCEVSKAMKTRKVRAMLIKKSLLQNFPEGDLKVEFDNHRVRVETLRQLSRAYVGGEKRYRFMEVEIRT